MRIPIGISNRHAHLSSVDVKKLFGRGYQLTKLKDITQPGQFACEETVTLSGPNGKIEHVRIVGPTRKESQVEILMGDNPILGIDAPVRMPGECNDGASLNLIGPAGECYISGGVIVSQKHMCCTTTEATDMGLRNGDKIKIKISGPRGPVFENVVVRAKDIYALDFYIDKEEADATGVKPGDWGEIIE